MSKNKSKTNIRGKVGRLLDQIEDWPTFDEGALVDKVFENYMNRKKGVLLYAEGCEDLKIKEQINLSKNQIYRLITERCARTHADGRIYGWRGLIPNVNIKEYKRIRKLNNSNGEGLAGALTLIFDIHPDLKENFDKRVLSTPTKNTIHEVNKNKRSHWKWLMKELRELDYERKYEWPFNTKYYGYVSICQYINNTLLANPEKAIRIHGKDSIQKHRIGDGVDRPVNYPFCRVEMDAHKIDARFCILVPDMTGEMIAKIIHRIWIISIIEVTSRAVLGYHLSFEKEVNQNDILRTIKKALTKWHPKDKMMAEMEYTQDAALPSYLSDKFLALCWDETSVDGALAENSKQVEKILSEVVGSKLISPVSKDVNFSKRRSKDDRPFIEVFFKTLTSNSFQRLSNTTGKDHQSKQGRDPEKIAVASRFQVEYAEELLDVVIANYNATPHSGLNYRTPLEYLNTIINKPEIQLRYAKPQDIQNILSFRKKCKVNGDIKKGRAPFVHFEGARYSNDILKQRYDLIGEYIWVINHLEDDARIALASTFQGGSLGILRAAPPWHKLPHSLSIRKVINSAIHRKIIHLSDHNDAIEEFLNFCESHKKLPVHPAYLEARRILIQQAEENIGQSMLESAKNKLIIQQDTYDQLDSESQKTHFVKKKKQLQSFEVDNDERSAQENHLFNQSKANAEGKFNMAGLPTQRKVKQ
ncbi:hypothetical protein MWMV2_MWMV2_00032 [Acinetobacter oleivorans]|nr:hypothetical protein MWMV12_MWMV12_00032 [Acinetobacter oleivorans]CAI3099788.1 hypothetical protein MWMV3_MWMV3_00032 [Acinetobacter oleivorans]CAI3099790.1 hypothetical protein MWMV19_MWMV19_00032 [Acinetobacter oleivorans]CAI3099819.1 hypothetical protein MWMV2_MWMV2_00032 [Acinetobacter oleivorans]CAI3118728.1 hypothetical protein MWMV5_MWMV5_01094 [Acinetobacter oleivorans]